MRVQIPPAVPSMLGDKMESLVRRVEHLSNQGCSVDAITYVFRSEGLSDIDIRNVYDAVWNTGLYDIVVERQIPRFVSKA